MAHRLKALVSRVLTHVADERTVHFHQGATGVPAACFAADCDNPRMDV